MPEPSLRRPAQHRWRYKGVRPEGRFVMSYSEVPRAALPMTRPTPCSSRTTRMADLAFGAVGGRSTMISPRIAPQLAGVGLARGHPRGGLARERGPARAARPGPIKGRLNRVWDPFAGAMKVGRFGWKANAASLAHQTAAAFQGRLGHHLAALCPTKPARPSKADCLAAPRGAKALGEHDIDDAHLGRGGAVSSCPGPSSLARSRPTMTP